MKNRKLEPDERRDMVAKMRAGNVKINLPPRYAVDFALPDPAVMDESWRRINRYYSSAFAFGGSGAGSAQSPDTAEGCEPPHPPAQPKDDRRVVRTHASYLTPLFNDIDVAVQKFRTKMRAVDFDTLVGTGISGVLAAQLFARAIGVNFALVRKPGDGSHSHEPVEGIVGRRWVFVDDLICTGETRTRVRESMKQFSVTHHFDTEYVGDYMYYGNTFRDRENGNSEEGSTCL